MNPFPQDPAEEIKKKLFNNAMKSNWEGVIKIYKQHPEAENAKITRSEDSALHIAIADGQESVVKELVGFVGKSALEIKNEVGNTPLHLAASLGNVKMCEYIASRDSKLIGIRNTDNETPFFLAVFHGKKEAFLRLHRLCADENEGYGYCRGRDGETILHSAIYGEYFDMAFLIIDLYPKLRSWVNEQGFSPLHILATKPSAFRSGSHIRGFDKLIYHCIFVDELNLHTAHTLADDLQYDSNTAKYPQNYQTCLGFFLLLRNIARILLGHSRQQRDEEYPKDQQLVCNQAPGSRVKRKNKKASVEGQKSEPGPTRYEAQGHEFLPENYFTCFHFIKFIAKAMLVILGLGSTQVVRIREKKERHIWSLQIMGKLLEDASTNEYENNGRSPRLSASEIDSQTIPYALGDGGAVGFNKDVEHIVHDDQIQTPTNASQNKKGEKINGTNGKGINGTVLEMEKKETPILIAAKNGIEEMVAGILELFPVAIHDVNNEKKNIVLLAVENRQPHVYKLLLDWKMMKEIVFRKTDKDGNSALHLAAMLGEHRPWLIPGAALQMQWEIKWYEFVKNSMPLHFFPRYNNGFQTSRGLFRETHRQLAKEGGEWLTNTSESCSVVAALIATVAFATSATVPGGIKSESGTPTLQNEPAFGIFAISSLVALCFSVTSVVMFLAILTSRYQEKDFGKDLPRKLLVGLTSLFVSIGSMLLSFCAGHFFVLKEKLKYAAFPMYAITCLPVTFFAMAQFPLYLDLVKATIKKVPQRSSK